MTQYNYTAVNRPAIDYHLSPNSARERIRKRLEPFGSALWDETPPNAAKTYEIGLSVFEDMERGEPSIRFLHQQMREHWEVSEADQGWDAIVLQALRKAMTDLWQRREAREDARRAQARVDEFKRKKEAARIRAEEEAAKKAKRESAALTGQIAKGLGITIRQARTIREEGTCNPERAQRLSEITGQDPSNFLRKDRRKRNADLVELFMTADHEHVSFTQFLADPDEVISDENVRTFLHANMKKFRRGEDFKSLERMIERAQDLGCPLTLESAKALWKDYKIWRISTISSMARYDVEDE